MSHAKPFYRRMASAVILGFASIASPAFAQQSWLTRHSTYSHDPVTGARVRQYRPIDLPRKAQVAITTSGYSHFRSSLNFGNSADHYHRVRSWGQPIRPYGEWRFPYRPYSVPYNQWGAPYAGLGPQFNVNSFQNIRPQFRQPNGGRNDDDVVGTNAIDPRIQDRFYPGGPNGYPGYGGYPGIGGNGSIPNPYPLTPASPYPNPPYYDGFHPTYRD